MIRSGALQLLIPGLLLALITTPALTEAMRDRPAQVRIGSVPHHQVLRFAALDHQPLVGAYYTLKALNYFGAQRAEGEVLDYRGIFQAIEGGLKLDPYNMDAYYFSQAILVWDLGQVELANSILEYGMRYRTWDPFLPFSAGFNHAYFLQDYPRAAEYFKKGAEISGSPLMTRLATRYLYEGGRTELAIAYLHEILPTIANEAIRRHYEVRLHALLAIAEIESALERYRGAHGSLPPSLDVLVREGFLGGVPEDPYGGQFYLDDQGRVRTTSKLATAPSSPE